MIIKRLNKKNFTTVSNDVVEDTRLSYDALGLLAYLISRPDGWEVHIDQLRTRARIGKDKIYRIVHELQAAGYMTHERIYENGRVKHGRWIVREEPETSCTVPDSAKHQTGTRFYSDQLHPEKPDEAFPRLENLPLGNLPLENPDA